VLVTDLDMPEMDGLTLLEQARARYPWMLRALLTGAATLDRALRAINAGEIVRFFPKPFDPDAFKQAVEALAPQIQQNRERSARAARADRVAGHLRWIEAANPGVTRLEHTPSGAVRIALSARLEEAARAGSHAGAALVLGS
jgi:DNA-binding NtrC family response regulator